MPQTKISKDLMRLVYNVVGALTGASIKKSTTEDVTVKSDLDSRVQLSPSGAQSGNITVIGYIDLNTNQIKNVIIHNVTSETRPGSPQAGQIIYETDTAKIMKYNGLLSAWQEIGTGGGGVTWVFEEVPTGDVNGSNTDFTLANAPNSNTEQVFKNGMLMKRVTDYNVVSGNIIRFVIAPETNSIILVTYCIT